MSKPKFSAMEKVIHVSGQPMRIMRVLWQTKDGEYVYQTISELDNLYEVQEKNLRKVKKGENK